jgi:hypothetical protein
LLDKKFGTLPKAAPRSSMGWPKINNATVESLPSTPKHASASTPLLKTSHKSLRRQSLPSLNNRHGRTHNCLNEELNNINKKINGYKAELDKLATLPNSQAENTYTTLSTAIIEQHTLIQIDTKLAKLDTNIRSELICNGQLYQQEKKHIVEPLNESIKLITALIKEIKQVIEGFKTTYAKRLQKLADYYVTPYMIRPKKFIDDYDDALSELVTDYEERLHEANSILTNYETTLVDLNKQKEELVKIDKQWEEIHQSNVIKTAILDVVTPHRNQFVNKIEAIRQLEQRVKRIPLMYGAINQIEENAHRKYQTDVEKLLAFTSDKSPNVAAREAKEIVINKLEALQNKYTDINTRVSKLRNKNNTLRLVSDTENIWLPNIKNAINEALSKGRILGQVNHHYAADGVELDELYGLTISTLDSCHNNVSNIVTNAITAEGECIGGDKSGYQELFEARQTYASLQAEMKQHVSTLEEEKKRVINAVYDKKKQLIIDIDKQLVELKQKCDNLTNSGNMILTGLDLQIQNLLFQARAANEEVLTLQSDLGKNIDDNIARIRQSNIADTADTQIGRLQQIQRQYNVARQSANSTLSQQLVASKVPYETAIQELEKLKIKVENTLPEMANIESRVAISVDQIQAFNQALPEYQQSVTNATMTLHTDLTTAKKTTQAYTQTITTIQLEQSTAVAQKNDLLHQLTRRSDEQNKQAHSRLSWFRRILIGAGAGGGATLGSAIGSILGLLAAGPFGAFVGFFAGAAVGAAVGGGVVTAVTPAADEPNKATFTPATTNNINYDAQKGTFFTTLSHEHAAQAESGAYQSGRSVPTSPSSPGSSRVTQYKKPEEKINPAMGSNGLGHTTNVNTNPPSMNL